MSTYRDRITGAGAFRGVIFYFVDVESEIGRRTLVKEFPGRDAASAEDLGLAARRFTIEMFVLGPDYDAARDELRVALETPGPAELVHPFWGVMNVVLEKPARVRESTKEQGIARFTASFVEVGVSELTTVTVDTGTALTEAAGKAADVAGDEFAEEFSVIGAIADVAEQAIEVVQGVASAINRIQGKIAAALQVIDDAQSAITDLSDQASELIRTPIALANSITDVISTVMAGINSVTDAFTALSEFFGTDGEDALPSTGSAFSTASRTEALARSVADLGAFGDDLPVYPENTAQEQIRMENQRQLVRLTKVSTAVEACNLAAVLDFESLDQADGLRVLITDLLDGMLNDELLPDALYVALANLRAAAVDHLSQAANSLPELDDYTPGATLPALVIAYQIYGDPRRESELLLRNPQLRDPTAVPGGEAIKVLSDG